jgi:hypothetical protein
MEQQHFRCVDWDGWMVWMGLTHPPTHSLTPEWMNGQGWLELPLYAAHLTAPLLPRMGNFNGYVQKFAHSGLLGVGGMEYMGLRQTQTGLDGWMDGMHSNSNDMVSDVVGW